MMTEKHHDIDKMFVEMFGSAALKGQPPRVGPARPASLTSSCSCPTSERLRVAGTIVRARTFRDKPSGKKFRIDIRMYKVVERPHPVIETEALVA